MEDVQDKIEIPKLVYQGDDKVLKERVSKFKEGTFRIVVFTIVGLVMGAYSHNYVADDFVVTKVLTAIPYKISEIIYVFLLGTDAVEFMPGISFAWVNEFFPHSELSTFLAETVTTILIGGAIYGALAYFTGDKRVFTLNRFLKFVGCWCAIILLVIGASYGINLKAKTDNETFKGDATFYFYHDTGGSRAGKEWEEVLRDYFYKELEPIEAVRDKANEVMLEICFDDIRYGIYQANYVERYVVTEQGRMYRISEEFAQIGLHFVNNRTLPEITEETEEAKEAEVAK